MNHVERLLNLPRGNIPAKLELLEQVILARNAAQHPDKITDLIPEHRRNDLEKHPRPFFMTESESRFLEVPAGSPSRPRSLGSPPAQHQIKPPRLPRVDHHPP